jgi:L-fuconolactonase
VRLNPTVRSPGSDPLAIWKAAARYGLSLSVLGGPPASLATDEFAQLIQTIPQTPIVLEHQAGDYNVGESSAGYSNDYASIDDVKKAFALSRFPNVYVMIGGLAEFAKPALPTTRPLPYAQPIPPIIDLAYDAFGPSRMMWGSDFPASARREGYLNSLREAMDYLSTKPIEERAQIFGGTGRAVFPIKSA